MIPGLADNSQSVGAKALKRKGVDQNLVNIRLSQDFSRAAQSLMSSPTASSINKAVLLDKDKIEE